LTTYDSSAKGSINLTTEGDDGSLLTAFLRQVRERSERRKG
jgi:hypothetical protein